MTTGCANPPIDRARRTLLLGSIGALVAAAWLALWLWSDPARSFTLHAHDAGFHSVSLVYRLSIVVLGWTIMTIAMMVPTTFPVIALFHTLAGERRDLVVLVTLVIAGYLAIWAAFGVAVYAGHAVLAGLFDATARSAGRLWLGGAPVLFVAGAYQFTSLKYRCLEKCRSPLSFVIQHWQGARDRLQAFRLGIDHGLFCVGCCWTLMLLMFVTGLGNLAWMFALAAVMAIEKNVAWGKRISAPLGIILLVCGVVVALSA